MSMTTVARNVLQFEYHVARLPLGFVESQVTRYLPESSALRLSYERALGSLDTVMGYVLQDEAAVRRGSALRDRSDALGRAAERRGE